jgi:translation initiation factor 2 subunit 2
MEASQWARVALIYAVMSAEPLFDPSLKKRSKKKQVAFTEDPLGADADPTVPVPSLDNTTASGDVIDLGPKTVHEQMKQNEAGVDDVASEPKGVKEEEDFKAMFGDLKKKKKKKEIPLDLVSLLSCPSSPPTDVRSRPQGDEGSGASTPTTSAHTTTLGTSEDLDFSDLKKKKKSSKKKATFDLEAFEKELQKSKSKDANADEEEDVPDGEHLNDIDETELGDDVFDRSEAPPGVEQGTEPWLGSDRDYTYQELLTRFYASLHASNPSLLTSTGKRYTIAPPSIHREGNKKSIFANISDICKRMHRQPEHVIQYLFAELGTTGSVDGSGRLVIKGRFQQKQIENVLRRYIGKS